MNDRLLKVRFNSNFVKMTVVVCYAQTEDAEEEIKMNFTINWRRLFGLHPSMIYC